MGASTVKVATYYEQLLARTWDVEVIKESKKSYVGDIRGDVHICNNKMIEFR